MTQKYKSIGGTMVQIQNTREWQNASYQRLNPEIPDFRHKVIDIERKLIRISNLDPLNELELFEVNPIIPLCQCGLTKDVNGYCDGSHNELKILDK